MLLLLLFSPSQLHIILIRQEEEVLCFLQTLEFKLRSYSYVCAVLMAAPSNFSSKSITDKHLMEPVQFHADRSSNVFLPTKAPQTEVTAHPAELKIFQLL